MNTNSTPTKPLRASAARARQRGAALLEPLVAVLMFSIGVLGMMELQGTAIRITTNAQYRTEAMLAANEVIGLMWLSSPATRQSSFGSSGAAYTAWRDEVIAALPGVSAGTNAPTVVFDATNAERVTVTVRWQLPGEDDVHAYVTTAEIPSQ